MAEKSQKKRMELLSQKNNSNFYNLFQEIANNKGLTNILNA